MYERGEIIWEFWKSLDEIYGLNKNCEGVGRILEGVWWSELFFVGFMWVNEWVWKLKNVRC